MALTEERKAELMAYCRIDQFEAGEESLFHTICGSAVGYMAGAGIKEPPVGTEKRDQYDLCINYLVLDGWDRRELQVDSKIEENKAFRRSFNQLKTDGVLF